MTETGSWSWRASRMSPTEGRVLSPFQWVWTTPRDPAGAGPRHVSRRSVAWNGQGTIRSAPFGSRTTQPARSLRAVPNPEACQRQNRCRRPCRSAATGAANPARLLQAGGPDGGSAWAADAMRSVSAETVAICRAAFRLIAPNLAAGGARV